MNSLYVLPEKDVDVKGKAWEKFAFVGLRVVVLIAVASVFFPGLNRPGGAVMMTARSGVKDEQGNCFEMVSIPGPFAKLCGIEVTESDALGSQTSSIVFVDQSDQIDQHSKPYPISGWADLIDPKTVLPIAVYPDRFYAGPPAITRNDWQNGSVWYVGTMLELDGYEDLLEEILQETSTPIEHLPKGMEKTIRKNDQNTYAFYFNNTDQPMAVEINSRKIEFKPVEAKILKNNQAWL